MYTSQEGSTAYKKYTIYQREQTNKSDFLKKLTFKVLTHYSDADRLQLSFLIPRFSHLFMVIRKGCVQTSIYLSKK